MSELPHQQLLDKLTRIDELLVTIINLLSEATGIPTPVSKPALEHLLTVSYAGSFDNIFPLLTKEDLAKGINFFWNAGVVGAGETAEFTYDVPPGFVDVADWLAWDLSEYYIADVEWARDNRVIWSENATTSYRLDWTWFRAEAHSWCRMRVTNNGTQGIRAIWRGQCFFLDKEVFDHIVSRVLDATNYLTGRHE